MDRVSEGKRTAEMVAAMRAVGARDPAVRNPDHLAERLLTRRFRALTLPGLRGAARAVAERRVPGMYLYHQARTVHLDGLFLAALEEVGQVVILGAGLDTRPYRFAEQLADRRVFEVDHPGTAAWKRARLHRMGRPTAHVTYVTTDFTTDRLDDTLVRFGVRVDEPTFFLWEGVSCYLPQEAVEATLATVAGWARGSSIAFDYVHRAALERPGDHIGAREFFRAAARSNEPVLSGLDPDRLSAFLDTFGLTLRSNVGPESLAALVPDGALCDLFSIAHAGRPRAA